MTSIKLSRRDFVKATGTAASYLALGNLPKIPDIDEDFDIDEEFDQGAGREFTVGDLTVKFRPWGPDQATIDRASRALLKQPEVQEFLKGTQHRLLSFELLDPEPEVKPIRIPKPPNRFRATIYDYTNNRAIVVDGLLILDKPKVEEVLEFGTQPLPNREEFDAAVEILLRDTELGPAIRENRLQPYPPMPPIIEAEAELPDGRIERTIAVGLLPRGEGIRHEIVGVNMIHETVVRFEGGAPETSVASDSICGLPNAFQSTASKGTAGQVIVTVLQGGTVLWRFLAVRPAASSGTRGSGLELRFVNYRRKRVLYRAHAPILNVKYDSGTVYRDWQWEEGMLKCSGINVGSGFRFCSSPAKTILDSGTDMGDFLGVAIYVQGQEVVLVGEMQAGWYRYISEWRLHADGTIRPRFGFSAVESTAVCNLHHHHVYWRFDFDIRTAGNNRVLEFNDPPIIPPSNWHTKIYEIKRFRNPTRSRKWRVENTRTGEAYDIIPSVNDGVATASPDWPYPRGDVWILRYHGSEIDDGYNMTGGPGTPADIDKFKNGELINNRDVVIWYAAHSTHKEPSGTFGQKVGPDLKPVSW